MIIGVTQENTPKIETIATKLVDSLAGMGSCLIAFSGGVDSSVVAQAAWLALGNRSVAITGFGAAVSEVDLHWARVVTQSIGIPHEHIQTQEISDPNYLRNDARRCYFCKSHLYSSLRTWALKNGFQTILSGTNFDDLDDYRPGLEAATENSVVAPLANLKIGKATIRELAKYWSLPVAERPASPCLASRIAYGEHVSEERLQRIETAEAWLHREGFVDVRVRLHADELARLEIGREDFGRLAEPGFRDAVNAAFRVMGFRYVTIDLGGRQSGSLNRSLTNNYASLSNDANRATLRQALPVLQ